MIKIPETRGYEVVKSGICFKVCRARYCKAERDKLASLEHLNIYLLFDCGLDPRGRSDPADGVC